MKNLPDENYYKTYWPKLEGSDESDDAEGKVGDFTKMSFTNVLKSLEDIRGCN